MAFILKMTADERMDPSATPYIGPFDTAEEAARMGVAIVASPCAATDYEVFELQSPSVQP